MLEDKPGSPQREPVEADRQGKQDGTGTQQEITEPRSLSDPSEDWYAWLQVLGAFCLNLNTW